MIHCFISKSESDSESCWRRFFCHFNPIFGVANRSEVVSFVKEKILTVASVFHVSGRNKVTDKFILFSPVFNFSKITFPTNVFNMFESGNFRAVRFFVGFDSEVEHSHLNFSPFHKFFRRYYSTKILALPKPHKKLCKNSASIF